MAILAMTADFATALNKAVGLAPETWGAVVIA
jgi:hypothetical protein